MVQRWLFLEADAGAVRWGRVVEEERVVEDEGAIEEERVCICVK